MKVKLSRVAPLVKGLNPPVNDIPFYKNTFNRSSSICQAFCCQVFYCSFHQKEMIGVVGEPSSLPLRIHMRGRQPVYPARKNGSAKLTQKDSISPHISRSSLLFFPAKQLDTHSVKRQRRSKLGRIRIWSLHAPHCCTSANEVPQTPPPRSPRWRPPASTLRLLGEKIVSQRRQI